jgi:predicted nuclease of predicted toxin-antitoxin system
MSKRRYFVLDEDISLDLRPIFGRKAKVVSIREFMKAAPDADVIEEALKREAVLVTNDSGLVAQYRNASRRTKEDACYPGLIHLRSEKELVQARMLKQILRKYVWNEVIEQDCLVTVSVTGADNVTVRHESLCHHQGYERKPVVRT